MWHRTKPRWRWVCRWILRFATGTAHEGENWLAGLGSDQTILLRERWCQKREKTSHGGRGNVCQGQRHVSNRIASQYTQRTLWNLMIRKQLKKKKKIASDFNWYFVKKDTQMAAKCMKRCSTSYVIRKHKLKWDTIVYLLLLLLLSHFSRVWLCVTPWTAAHQAPPYLGFSRQEYWSGLPFPSPMHESEVAQSYPTPSDPMDCGLPGSSVHGIFQAKVLEWGAIAFSVGGYWKPQISRVGMSALRKMLKVTQ